jgi:RNA polymerase sigma factor (sigma-70 family)
MDAQTDAQLLRAYAERRADAAFAELVRRHLDLVHSAARRMVGDAHLAEDVTQATFLALAKSAAQLTERPVLAGWLHRTAQNIAAQTVRTDVRRRAREQEAAAMNELLADSGTVAPPAWSEIAPHLDAALGELTEPERDVVLLRYFQRQSAREMAQTLGISDEAAQKRVSRAVDRLREFFAKRGVTVGASGLAVVISANAVQAAPVGLALTISTAAALTGTALVTTATVTATKAIAMTTIQKTLITATVAVLAGVGIYEARQASQLRAQVQSLQQQQAPLVEQIQQLQRERNEATNRLTSLQDDNERLNRSTGELLRLRGEVARLRKEQGESKSIASNQPSNPATNNMPTLLTHQATNHAAVSWGQSIVTGGWELASGKRGLVFATPTKGDDETQITISTRFIAMPDEAYGDTLGRMFPQDSGSLIMTEDSSRSFLDAVEKLEGFELLGVGRITTLSGRQAQMQMNNASPIGEVGRAGRIFDVMPTISANGQTVDLKIVTTLIEDTERK